MKKLIDRILERYMITYDELIDYFKILLYTAPVYFSFMLKGVPFLNISGIIEVLFTVYVILFLGYNIFTIKNNVKLKLIVTLMTGFIYMIFDNLSFPTPDEQMSILFFGTILYILLMTLYIRNKYYNKGIERGDLSLFVLFAKRYALYKFNSEYIASTYNVRENATRRDIKNDLDDLYKTHLNELKRNKIKGKSLKEYSEERVKMREQMKSGAYGLGTIDLGQGIKLPISEYDNHLPVVKIEGINNNITNTISFARKCRTGVDAQGNKFVYPITPYLNEKEIDFLYDSENVILTAKDRNLQYKEINQLRNYINILNKAIDCYNDYYDKVKETIDKQLENRQETVVEHGFDEIIKKYIEILKACRIEVDMRTSNTQTIVQEDKQYQINSCYKKSRDIEADNVNFVKEEDKLKDIRPREAVFEEGMFNLAELIGLDKVKSQINELVSKYKIDKKATEMGLPEAKSSNHLVFVGNPGTGKTIVARILGKLLYGLEITNTYNVTEVARASLIGTHIGETEEKTKKVIEEVIAHKGILFIDEFHQLYNDDSQRDFGHEVIKVLISMIENYREQFVCIIAGYPDQIRDTIKKADPGLESRFTTYINFEDYNPEELVKIFKTNFCNKRYVLNPEAEQVLYDGFKMLYSDYDFGNARGARKVFEKAVKKQTLRLAEDKEVLSRENLMLLQPKDIQLAINEILEEQKLM